MYVNTRAEVLWTGPSISMLAAVIVVVYPFLYVYENKHESHFKSGPDSGPGYMGICGKL